MPTKYSEAEKWVHMVTVKLKNETRLTCKLKFDGNSTELHNARLGDHMRSLSHAHDQY